MPLFIVLWLDGDGASPISQRAMECIRDGVIGCTHWPMSLSLPLVIMIYRLVVEGQKVAFDCLNSNPMAPLLFC